MRRREFITLLGAATAFWPFVARSQQPPKLRTIGFLGPNTAALDGPRVSALVQRLHELGWIEGRTIAIEYRWAEGRNEHLAEIAAEFVRLKVDVIVTSATPTTVAVKKATSSIPVVFASVGDPIGAGLVASLARPGANVTGLSLQMSDTAGKKLGIIREAVPGLHHVAIMANVDNASAVLVRLSQRPVRLASTPSNPKSGDRRISRQRLKHLRAMRTHFTFAMIRWLPRTGFASASWRWVRACQRCTAPVNTSKRVV